MRPTPFSTSGSRRHDELHVRAVGRGRRHDRGVAEVESVEFGVVGQGDDDVRVADPDREPRAIDRETVGGDHGLPRDDERSEVDLEAVGGAGQVTHSATSADRDGRPDGQVEQLVRDQIGRQRPGCRFHTSPPGCRRRCDSP